METQIELFKALSDRTRIRLLMLVAERELCVCQIMAVLGVSQPLVSRNLSILKQAGLVTFRRKGKLTFYALKNDGGRGIIPYMERTLRNDPDIIRDMQVLNECEEFKIKTGKCDMRSFKEFMRTHRKGAKEQI